MSKISGGQNIMDWKEKWASFGTVAKTKEKYHTEVLEKSAWVWNKIWCGKGTLYYVLASYFVLWKCSKYVWTPESYLRALLWMDSLGSVLWSRPVRIWWRHEARRACWFRRTPSAWLALGRTQAACPSPVLGIGRVWGPLCDTVRIPLILFSCSKWEVDFNPRQRSIQWETTREKMEKVF